MLLTVLLLLATPDAAPAAAPAARALQKIAVLDMEGIALDASIARVLTESLTTEVGRASGAQVIGRQEIGSMLGFERDKQLAGCTDDVSCVTEIGGALGV